MLKNLPTNAGDTEGVSLIPGLGRCPVGGNGNPLQYSRLENSCLDRGAWWATDHRITKALDMTEQLSARAHVHTHTHTQLKQVPICVRASRSSPLGFAESHH